MTRRNARPSFSSPWAIPGGVRALLAGAAIVLGAGVLSWAVAGCTTTGVTGGGGTAEILLRAVKNEAEGKIEIFRDGTREPILTQNAQPDHRPFLHPIVAPDGNGVVTQYSPGHHPHQTGLYWGFTRVNGTGADEETMRTWFYRRDKPPEIQQQIGRDFFHNPGGDFWRLQSATVLAAEGEEVKWRTVYDMLDEAGDTIMVETQTWTMRQDSKGAGRYVLDLEWNGEAATDVTINEMEYGGMFVRMPWHQDIAGEAVNAARQKNAEAEGQRAMWVDVGMEIEGRDDWAHFAIFDHPRNTGFPQTWRVDFQLGVGPARSRMGDWHISQGTSEIIRHRIIVYTGELNDLELTEEWQDYSGTYYTAALWQLAQDEALEEKFLDAEEAVAAMTTLPGYEASAWASEPMITQPMAFAWDDRGRMWIAENRDYETRGSGFSSSGDSKVLILEDTNRDGQADKKTIFAEGIPFPSALAVGFDGVFLGAPPHLLFLPDKDGDDQAEMDELEILLTGWGIRDRHETINSFHWGPDGWLYGLEGFATPSVIREPDASTKLYGHNDEFPADLLEADGTHINGGVWRYHPTKRRFEVVGHGFSNPWGIDYDAKGQLFISACVIPHLFHVVPGGIFHRQGGQHFNPFVYGDIRTIVDHRHRSAHGGARVYLSDAFPEEQHGRLFMANIHEHAVLTDDLVPRGSGFTAKHGDEFMKANNAQWIGFSMEIGPAGNVYVLDWHDADICGNSVHHKETGRIYRIAPQQSLAEDWEGRYGDLKTFPSADLVQLQLSKSAWHARRARVILQGRAAKGELEPEAHERLREIFAENPNGDLRLRAMWALHITGGFETADLMASLDDSDEHVRAWAIQLLNEDRDASPEALAKFADMARTDSSAVVRLYLASALQRLRHDNRWAIAEGLMSHGEDAGDHNIPKMIWFGIEPLVPESPARALELGAQSAIPMLRQHVARRLVDADEIDRLITAVGERSDAQVDLLEGMRAALDGRFDMAEPAGWEEVNARLARNRKTADIALDISQQFGSIEASMEFMATLQDKGAPRVARHRALRGLARQQLPELVELIPGLMDEDDMRIEAIRAMAAFDSRELAGALSQRYESFDAEAKLAAVQTMSSRSSYGAQLTRAIADGEIPRRDIPAYVARQLHRVVGSGFLETWGSITRLDSEKSAAIARFSAHLTTERLATADVAAGRKMFSEVCGVCHQLYSEGGLIGPELTGANRTDLNYLLTNMIDPSGDIQDDYQTVMVTTRDGRTYSGTVAGENERTLTLRVVGEDAVAISKADIESRDIFPLSMMPEGLLDELSDQEVTNLVSYLMTAEGTSAAAESP